MFGEVRGGLLRLRCLLDIEAPCWLGRYRAVESLSGFIGSDVANDCDSSQIQVRGGPDLLLGARGRRSLAMQASIRVVPGP